MAEAEPHLAVALVVEALVNRLCLLEANPHIRQELVPVRHVLGHGHDACLTRFIRTDGRGIMAVNQLEWSLLKSLLVGGVVDVFCPRQPTQPLTRMIPGEAV
jgi:hypothetical protein